MTWQTRPRARHAQPHARRRARCARSSSELRELDPPVYRAPGHRGLPQRQQGDDAAGDARQRRAQPHAAPQRRHPLDRDAQRARTCPTPSASSIDDLGYRDDGISHVTARLGFQDETDVPRLLALAVAQGLEGDCDVDHGVLLPLAHHDRRRPTRPGMARWRKKLFLAIARNAVEPGRVLRAARRPHGRHGLAREFLSASP